MAVGVGDQQAVGFEQLQRACITWCEQAARHHALGRGSPVVHRTDVLRVIDQQRDHAKATRRIFVAWPWRIFMARSWRRAVKAFGFKKHAARTEDDLRPRCRHARLRERLQRQLLADQQIADALVCGGVACR